MEAQPAGRDHKTDLYYIKQRLKTIRYRCKQRRLPYNLDPERIVVPERCPVLNIPLVWNVGKQRDNSPSFDRIDSTLGYTHNNVRIISWRANDLKKNGTVRELLRVCKYTLIQTLKRMSQCQIRRARIMVMSILTTSTKSSRTPLSGI